MTTTLAPHAGQTYLREEKLDHAGDPSLGRPRPLRSRTFDDKAAFGGSLAASAALTWFLAAFVLPFSGLIGFFITWYLMFVLIYVATTALSSPRPVVVDRIVSAVVHAAAGLTGLALISAVTFPFIKGYQALFHVNFVTQDQHGVGPQDAFTRGGVWHAIVGTLIEMGIAVMVALPLGVGAAIFMSEVGGRLAWFVRTIVEAMTALPSIVAGLFIYTVLIVDLHIPKTGFTASMALAVMILPIIARASDVVLRVVPSGLREASLALGASRWQTVWRVVLPTVRPGLATALILGIARGVGETSPVLLTSGASTFFNDNPFSQPMNSLPLYTYTAVRSGEPRFIERGFASAAVLLTLVLMLFVIARLIARQRVR
jgi:phosphate transport system permease protein